MATPKTLTKDLEHISQWIHKEYGAKPLTLKKNVIDGGKKIRLLAVFENDLEAQKLYRADSSMMDYEKHDAIAKNYVDWLEMEHPESPTPIVFVVATTSRLLNKKIDETNRILSQELEYLKRSYPDQVWYIMRYTIVPDIFFYSDSQLDLSKVNGLQQALNKEVMAILKRLAVPMDFDEQTFTCGFDSKERFDTHFSSNWYYYYK